MIIGVLVCILISIAIVVILAAAFYIVYDATEHNPFAKRFPCSECVHCVDGDRCKACFDGVTGDAASCRTWRNSFRCIRNARSRK